MGCSISLPVGGGAVMGLRAFGLWVEGERVAGPVVLSASAKAEDAAMAGFSTRAGVLGSATVVTEPSEAGAHEDEARRDML